MLKVILKNQTRTQWLLKMEPTTMPNLEGTLLSSQAKVNEFVGTSFLDTIKTRHVFFVRSDDSILPKDHTLELQKMLRG